METITPLKMDKISFVITGNGDTFLKHIDQILTDTEIFSSVPKTHKKRLHVSLIEDLSFLEHLPKENKCIKCFFLVLYGSSKDAKGKKRRIYEAIVDRIELRYDGEQNVWARDLPSVVKKTRYIPFSWWHQCRKTCEGDMIRKWSVRSIFSNMSIMILECLSLLALLLAVLYFLYM